MTKIGRNAPCPCGSGKKYKKCCIDKTPPAIKASLRNSASSRGFHWSVEEVETFQTEEIFQKLRGFGVQIDKDRFREDVNNFYSATELADSWHEKFTIIANGFDEDFIWMASIVLWNRLTPDVISSEKLDDMMQEGYDLDRGGGNGETKKACELWLEVWDHLKKRFTEDMKSIDDAEKVFSGMQCLSNWCQDLDELLYNAAFQDPSYHRKRIEYCREFCSLFPESDEILLVNMKRAAAESYFEIGNSEEGEKAFRALIEEYPDNVWGYIGWGDMYAEIEGDPDKAKEIYQMALNIESEEERRYVLQRIESLEEES